MPAPNCQIHDCLKPASWEIKTTGHPNTDGVLIELYCASHWKSGVAPWPESPKQYKIEITGPLNKTKNT